MGRTVIETLLGAVVLSTAIGFGVYAYQRTDYQDAESYILKAKFDSVDGIGVGSDVRVGGIKVGVVSSMTLDNDTYLAVTNLAVNDTVKMPTDSSAAIVSEGLLGGRYVSLTPGGEEAMLQSGDEIIFTQSSVNLESLIGRFMFSGGGLEDDEEDDFSDDGSLGLSDIDEPEAVLAAEEDASEETAADDVAEQQKDGASVTTERAAPKQDASGSLGL